MSTALASYIRDIQERAAAVERPWYWPSSNHRWKPITYLQEFNPATLALKAARYIRRRRTLAPLRISQPASDKLYPSGSYRIIANSRRPHDLQITFDERCCEPKSRPVKIVAGNRKLIVLHAFYQAEATQIFERLRDFEEYDIVLTTSSPAIREEFLGRFAPEKSASFFVENRGRDVLPFLLVMAFLDLSRYTHFIKLHTKRSLHAPGGSRWFSSNVEMLVGNKGITDELLGLIDPTSASIYGLETRPLRDHFRNNRRWLQFLMPDGIGEAGGAFVPGTMFAGSAEYLRRLATMNLHLRAFESEAGQLDGCLIHALERYFGYFAAAQGGRCATFDWLLR